MLTRYAQLTLTFKKMTGGDRWQDTIETEVKKLFHSWKVISICIPLISGSSNLLGWKWYHLGVCQDNTTTVKFMRIKDLFIKCERSCENENLEKKSQRLIEIVTNQYFWNTRLVDKLKLARKNKNSSTSGCQRATGKGECGEVYGNCCLWEIIASCSYLLGGSTVKYLVEGLGSLLDTGPASG